jgi:hypothetical protein
MSWLRITAVGFTVEKSSFQVSCHAAATRSGRIGQHSRTQGEDGGSAVGGTGDKKVNDVSLVVSEQGLVGGKLELGKTQFIVHRIGASVVLPADRKFGGILGTRTLAPIGASLDFGSYSLLVPKSLLSDK